MKEETEMSRRSFLKWCGLAAIAAPTVVMAIESEPKRDKPRQYCSGFYCPDVVVEGKS